MFFISLASGLFGPRAGMVTSAASGRNATLNSGLLSQLLDWRSSPLACGLFSPRSGMWTSLDSGLFWPRSGIWTSRDSGLFWPRSGTLTSRDSGLLWERSDRLTSLDSGLFSPRSALTPNFATVFRLRNNVCINFNDLKHQPTRFSRAI